MLEEVKHEGKWFQNGSYKRNTYKEVLISPYPGDY
jgi:hypothetical protein